MLTGCTKFDTLPLRYKIVWLKFFPRMEKNNNIYYFFFFRKEKIIILE